MINRRTGKSKVEIKPQDSRNPQTEETSAKAAFAMYGKGGRAWVERSWSASSLSFSSTGDSTRRI
jgi:hypothetical protein